MAAFYFMESFFRYTRFPTVFDIKKRMAEINFLRYDCFLVESAHGIECMEPSFRSSIRSFRM